MSLSPASVRCIVAVLEMQANITNLFLVFFFQFARVSLLLLFRG